MAVTYTPAAADALYTSYAGVPFEDPGDTAYVATDPRRVDSKYFLKPVQDEILNLIALMSSAVTALLIKNGTGSSIPAGPIRIIGYSSADARFLVAPGAASTDNTATSYKQPYLEITAALAAGGTGIGYFNATPLITEEKLDLPLRTVPANARMPGLMIYALEKFT